MSGEPAAMGLRRFKVKTREKLSLAVGSCHFKIGMKKYLSFMIEVICKLEAHTFNEPTTATT